MPKTKSEKGTPEYYAELAGWKVAREARKAQEALERPPESLPEADEVYDLGDPDPARMAAPSASPKEKFRKGRRPKLTKAEMLKEEDVARHIKQPLDFLSRIEGHEHWHRETDEIAEIAGPATRIINRHPEWVDLIRVVGDPGALIFACMMVLGPSVIEEINRARGHQQPAMRSEHHRPGHHHAVHQPPRQSQEPLGGRAAGNDFPGPAQVQSAAAAIVPPPTDLPAQFVA